jgi:uncharacterized protein
MRNKKFVLDANIWVSYFVSNDFLILIQVVSLKRIQLLYLIELLQEVERVLQYPHLKKRNIDVKKSLDFIKSIGMPALITYPIKQYIPDDEYDNYVIALALQANAGFVTNGDRHILSQKYNLEKKYKKLQILTKAEFETMFEH